MSYEKVLAAIDNAEIVSDGKEKPANGGGTNQHSRDDTSSKEEGGGAGGTSFEWSIDQACAQFPRTDLGNAQRLVKRHGCDFLVVPERGCLAWDGKRWNAAQADAILQRAVHETVRAIAQEADAIAGTRDDLVVDVTRKGEVKLSDKIRGWCLASQGAAHIAAVPRLASSYLSARSDTLDADPMALNVLNGTLRFAKSEHDDYITLHPHRREDRITKIAPVVYDPDATCPVYDAFLARVQPDDRVQRHLHMWGGLSLTGLEVPRLAVWFGSGRNGKSTLIEAWSHVLGDYSQTIPIESFLDQGRARRGGEASPDIAALPGVRCLRTSEPERGARLAESMVKLVTGGEAMRARHLNRDFFEFRPSFKLTMQGNYRPEVRGTDEGIWARILLVPWTVMIPAEERDPDLPAKLQSEASGILNRLLDGLRDYLDHGLVLPDAVTRATADYRADSDPIGRFLAECTEARPPAERARVAGREMYKTYLAWAAAEGEKAWTPKAVSRGLQDHGIRRLKSNGVHYLDVVLTRSPADFDGLAITDDAPD